MSWRRAATRYGQTPAPATPYQRAEQLWDERIGSARVQAANWRLMAFGALALAAVVMGDDIRARSRSIVTPYVVEVDRTGAANAIAPAVTEYQPSDAQIGYFLARFVQNTRALSVDPHCRAAGVARRLRPDHEPCQARARRLRAAGRSLWQGRTPRSHGRSRQRGA